MRYNFAEEMGKVVAAVSARMLPILQANDPDIRGVFYEYGHPLEIDETLRQYDKLPDKRYEKYPLVMLIEDIGTTWGGYYPIVDCRIVIAHHTQPNLKSKEREAKTFIPVLDPIYEALKEEIANHLAFNIPDATMLKHKEWRRKFWGRPAANNNEANKFCDYIDAIDMENVKITLNQKMC